MLNLEEVAKILGVGSQTVAEWAEKGKIESVFADGKYHFRQADVDLFIERTGIKLVEPVAFDSKIKDALRNQFEFGNAEKVLNEHFKEQNILTPEEIANLLKEDKR